MIDVRLNNSSQLSGFAKRDDLAYFLRTICNMGYVQLPILAPTPEMLSAYRKREITWNEYEHRFLKLVHDRAIESAVSRASISDGVLLCSEDRPEHCHRRIVAEYFAAHWEDVTLHHLV